MLIKWFPAFKRICSEMDKNYQKKFKAEGERKVTFLLSDPQSNKKICTKHQQNILGFSRQWVKMGP